MAISGYVAPEAVGYGLIMGYHFKSVRHQSELQRPGAKVSLLVS